MASGNSTGEYICRIRAYHQLTHLTIRGIEPSNRSVSYKLKNLLVIFLLLTAFPSYSNAQTTGVVSGFVFDQQNNALDGVQIIFHSQDTEGFSVETTSNSTGKFSQFDLLPGHYVITAETEDLGAHSFRVRVYPGQSVQVNFKLEQGNHLAPWQDGLVDQSKLTDMFDEGVSENRMGNFERAIAKFQEVLRIYPRCIDCRYNIGIAYTRLEDYLSAETAFKKAIEIRPDFVTSYYGLAAVYDKQEKTEEATRARSQANRLAVEAMAISKTNARNIFSQAIIFFNAGNVTEAMRQFQQAEKLDPSLVSVHYWLGLANLAEGNQSAAEKRFERYLLLVPNGQYTDEATEALGKTRH